MDAMQSLRSLHPTVADGLIAVAIGMLEVLSLRVVQPPTLALALAALGPLPLVLRRRRPGVVLVLVLAVETVYALLGYPYPGAGPALVLAVYSTAAHRPRRASLAALSLSWAVLAALTGLTEWSVVDLVAAVAVTAGVWLLGDSNRVRRNTIAELEERTTELESLQGQLAAQAAAAERTRIARELHDVVAHSMSVIAVQSGVGERLVDSRPDEARQVLATIRDVSREALDELRRMLGVLRHDEPDALRPPPRLADLPALIAQAEQAGLHVQMSEEGDRPQLPGAFELAAYRIVQEALTNVAKHAGPTDVHIGLHYGEHDLGIEVSNADSARSRAAAGAGVGLLGMQERTTMFGGTLEYGQRDGRFIVAAQLPLPGGRR